MLGFDGHTISGALSQIGTCPSSQKDGRNRYQQEFMPPFFLLMGLMKWVGGIWKMKRLLTRPTSPIPAAESPTPITPQSRVECGDRGHIYRK